MAAVHRSDSDRKKKRFRGPQCVDKYEAWFREHPDIRVFAIRESDYDEKPFFEVEYLPPKVLFH